MKIFRRYAAQTLRKNKTRTLVTIIGILLSASMITAVTTMFSSLQEYLYQRTVSVTGDWHGAAFGLSGKAWNEKKADRQLDSYVTLENLGYALLEGCQNQDKPYLYLGGMDEEFAEHMPVKITSGRMPAEKNEVLIPNHVRSNGGVYLKLGDTLTLQAGRRMAGDKLLDQRTAYMGEGEETLEAEKTVSYQIVGFYERPDFEARSAPGYTALVLADGSSDRYDVYMKLKSPKEVFLFLQTRFSDVEYEVNSDLLRAMGISGVASYRSMFTGLCAILIGIIMFGSISLIYNAFSISVSERTRQFGLIGSLGATKRQMIRCVLYEALILSAVGIPLGILAGIGGIGITLAITGNMLDNLLYGAGIRFGLHVSPWSVILAAGIGLITVLISAWIPARRALRVPAIEAIRQTGDVRISPRKVRTSRLTYRLFGFEGMIAKKNMKRSKKKYRATVISLFMSILLFISASSFCAYLSYSINAVSEDSGIDLIYELHQPSGEEIKTLTEKLAGRFSQVTEIDRQSWLADYFHETPVELEKINPEYLKRSGQREENGIVYLNCRMYYIKDQDYKSYLEENGLDPQIYLYGEEPKALLYNKNVLYEEETGRYVPLEILKEPVSQLEIIRDKDLPGLTATNTYYDEEQEKMVYEYVDEQGKEVLLSREEVEESVSVLAGQSVEKLPYGVRNISGLICLLPYSAMEKVEGLTEGITFVFSAVNHQAAEKKIAGILEDEGLDFGNVYNLAESEELTRTTLLMVNIFSYGFIILISLIAAANVFNTISTNMNLRRREFAMLRSMGMSRRGFYRMMRFECLLYGLKGLLYGIPAAVLVTYLIYLSVNEGIAGGFFIPWYSLCIVVISVFLVVFSTMLYSAGKIKKENTVDALKNENY